MKSIVNISAITFLIVVCVACADSNTVNQEEFNQLKADFTHLSDEQKIVGLSNAFTDAAGQKDKELFRSLWAADGEWIIGPPINKTFKGRDSIANAFEHLIDSWEFFVQLNSGYNVHLSNEEKTATANFYLNEIARNAKVSNFNLATYRDKLVKVNGRWYFKERNYVVKYLDTTELRGTTFY